MIIGPWIVIMGLWNVNRGSGMLLCDLEGDNGTVECVFGTVQCDYGTV